MLQAYLPEPGTERFCPLPTGAVHLRPCAFRARVQIGRVVVPRSVVMASPLFFEALQARALIRKLSLPLIRDALKTTVLSRDQLLAFLTWSTFWFVRLNLW